VERRLGKEVRARLASREPRWHFQRRQGVVPEELIAVAEELSEQHDGDANVVIIVGGSAHNHHGIDASVASSLVRRNSFPVIAVP
jgi:nucleotide-binding universal stress UspA family protein